MIPFAGPFSPVPSNDTANSISVSAASLAFTSRGNVTINSTSTSVNPAASPNWLLTPECCNLRCYSTLNVFKSFSAIQIS